MRTLAVFRITFWLHPFFLYFDPIGDGEFIEAHLSSRNKRIFNDNGKCPAGEGYFGT